ncbi:hypothetical protein U1Q18_022106 [Sarracenia purpurea var. burkii]
MYALFWMKVYTVSNESVLAKFIPFSTPKLKIYEDVDIPYAITESLTNDLQRLKQKHESSLEESDLEESAAESAKKKLSKLFSTFLFCLNELGVWLAFKAAEFLSCEETDVFSWGKLDVCGETIVRNFSLDALKVFCTYMPSGPAWSIGDDIKANMESGYLSSRVICLIESLLGYGRTIIFFVARPSQCLGFASKGVADGSGLIQRDRRWLWFVRKGSTTALG